MNIAPLIMVEAAGGSPPGPMVWSANTGSDFTTVEDAGIKSSGASGVISFGVWVPGDNSDTMLWRPSSGFNTTNIPNEITSATFRLFMFEQFGTSVVTVHENLRAWVTGGGEPSWTEYSSGNAWATAGGTGTGDRSASAIGSQATPATNNVWVEVTLDAATVEAWRQAGGAPSLGIQLRGDGQFSSYRSNTADDGVRPELVLGFD